MASMPMPTDFIGGRLCAKAWREAFKDSFVSTRKPTRFNDNGHLLCDCCNEPFPYSNPHEDGGFECTNCKTTKEMFK